MKETPLLFQWQPSVKLARQRLIEANLYSADASVLQCRPLFSNTFINMSFEGPWRLFAWSRQGPEILHKLLCLVKGRLKNTQHSAQRSSQNSLPATQQHTTPAVWGLSAELSSPLSQHMSGRVCLSPRLPATVATAGERLCSANCLASHTQTLSRNPLSYCLRSLPLQWKNSRIIHGCVF